MTGRRCKADSRIDNCDANIQENKGKVGYEILISALFENIEKCLFYQFDTNICIRVDYHPPTNL